MSKGDIHEKLGKILRGAVNGMTKTQLHKEARCLISTLSRPTIDRHLKVFMNDREVEKWGRRFFWRSNLSVQLERYRLILDIIDKQEKADAVFRIKITQAQDALTGEALRKRLDEIYLNELKWRAQILKEMKMRGVIGAEEREAMLRGGIRILQGVPAEKRLEALRKYVKTLHQSTSED